MDESFGLYIESLNAARTFPESGAVVTDRSTAERAKMGINEVQNAKSLELMASQGERKAASVDRSTSFSKIFGDTQLKCPYSHLAKDGLIEYNGVVFVCDYKRNSICLGDVSDSKNVLNISLPSGGNLKVNVDNLGDLSKAAGMFTPADLNAIMRAIAQYNHCTKKLNELDEEEIETVENVTDKADEQQEIHEDEAANNEEDTFEEFCKFMDAKDAEARANAPKVKNPYLEMANYILNQRKKEA